MPTIKNIPGQYRFFFLCSFDCNEPRHVHITEDTITAYLVDGRIISVPLAWSWRLSEATAMQRAHYEIIGDGHSIHWLEIDEDISAEGMLYGVPAPRSRKSSGAVIGKQS